MRVLIIKLTSMGDLMHALPSITDARIKFPNISFDWVVDESFSEVPKWHPAVNNVITTAHRRWKKKPFTYLYNGEFKQFYKNLNNAGYDVVLDFQGNHKSAFVSSLYKGAVHGYDKYTCREKLAYLAYASRYSIQLNQHAIERQRELLANILNYEKPATVADYGIDTSSFEMPNISLPEKYVVFVHNASWPTKLWPVEYWQKLIKLVSDKGYSILLPCGSPNEYEQAKNIATISSSAIALPKTSLNEIAAIMLNAKAAVCSDTGLAHMAAVLSVPSITLYAVTDTNLIGTIGKNQQHIVANKSSLKANMKDISVEQVSQALTPLLQ